MKRYIHVSALALGMLLLCASAWAGGGYTIESITAGLTDIYNAANRTDEDIGINIKALVRYYPYDTDSTLTFRNGISAPVTRITVETTEGGELWSMEGTDLFKSAQHGGTTTAEDQAAFFEGRTNPANGPLFAGVKKDVVAAARKEGVIISGFGDADLEHKKFTLNAKAEEDTAVGIRILYETNTSGANPSLSYTEDTDSDAYGWADCLKISVGDADGVLVLTDSEKSEYNVLELEGTAVYETVLTAKPSGISGKVTVTAELVNDDGYRVVANSAVVVMSTSFDVHEEPGSDAGTQPVSLNVSNLAGTASDPTRDGWDGIDLYAGENDDENKTNNPGPGTAGKAKIAAISATNFTAGNFRDQPAVITVKGAAPNVWVYIARKDAKTLFPGEDGEVPEENIYLTQQNIIQYGLPFRVTGFERGGDTKDAESSLTITFNGAKTAFTNFPLTVAVQNSAMKSPATKTFKLSAKPSELIRWKMTSLDEYGSEAEIYAPGKIAVTVPLSEDSDLDSATVPTVYTVSGEGHYIITVKPAEKNGIEAEVTQPEFDAFGGVVTPGSVEFTGSVEAQEKESKTAFTVTAANTFTKKKTTLKVSVEGKIGATIKDKTGSADETGLQHIDPKKTKSVAAGKVPAVTLKAAGSKTITWRLGDDEGYLEDDSIETSDYYAAVLAGVGLSFDSKTGKLKALTTANAILPTTNSAGEFESLDIVVNATNGYGPGDWARLWVTVTGAKPSLATTKLTLSRDAFRSGDIAGVVRAKVGKTELTSSDTAGFRVKFSPLNKKGKNEDTEALAALGLELIENDALPGSEYYNCGLLRVREGGLKASKNAKVSLRLENIGAESKGTLSLTINDPVPEIDTDRTGMNLSTGGSVPYVTLTGSKTAKVSSTLTLWISDETAPTSDSTKITWKVSKPQSSNITASVKADSASKGRKATVTFTLAKNKLTAEEDDFVVQATNAANKQSGTMTIHVAANKSTSDEASAPANNGGSSPESSPEARTYGNNEAGTVDVYYDEAVRLGVPRTLAQLSPEHRAFIEGKGYVVVAVLPELSSETEGQHELPAELFEDAPVGAKLVYLPFPKDAEETEDDRIADFYDTDGAPIEEVPSCRTITVDAWLRAGVTYEPVIVVEK
ncbi:MAG: hypothetical protein IJT02_03480 [Synergistaceae bacterium]|nr:hypothetical protein [Synergistaceae bacterium]